MRRGLRCAFRCCAPENDPSRVATHTTWDFPFCPQSELFVSLQEKARRIFELLKRAAVMRPRSYFPPGAIKKLLFFTLLLIGTTVVAQTDNRYCKIGDTPDFGAIKDGPAALPSRCIN